MRHLVPVLVISLALQACESDSPPPETDAAVLPSEAPEPPSPQAWRLTRAQYVAVVQAALGDDVVVPKALEEDAAVAGFFAVGARGATISRRGVEQYEAAAYAIAEQAIAPERRDRWVPCAPTAVRDDACAEAALEAVGRRLWRVPPDAAGVEVDLETLVEVAGGAAAALGDFHEGLAFGLAAMLQSPRFLFRLELGEDDPEQPGRRRVTAWELASRLSFALWNAGPDEALLDAAEAGELDTREGLEAQLDRMLASPRAREGVRSFFGQLLELHELDEARKDPTVFLHAGADLAQSARDETLRMVERHVLDLDGDYRALFTTRETFLNRTLAALYDVPAPEREGLALTELPAHGARAGLLGQASFLALHAHPTASSATLRGKFVRERLLCGVIPVPPVNANTGLPEPSEDAKTLRERAAIHLEDPGCSGCHSLMDPIGLGFERFDGVGRYRESENGAPIDPSGELDGEFFGDARDLGYVVANHPDLGWCFTRHLFRYTHGRLEQDGEEALVQTLADRFAERGFRVLALLRAIVLDPSFRALGPIEEAP